MASLPHSHHKRFCGLLQKGAFDIQAMTLALAAAVTPPLNVMVPRRPARYFCNPDALTLLTVMFVGCQLAQGSHAALLLSREWFHGGTGTSNNVSLCCPTC